MCEYEVVKTDLSPEEHLHVDLVRVERAEEDILGVEIVAAGDFGVELLHVGEARYDAGGAAVRLLAVEGQLRPLRFLGRGRRLLLLLLLLLLLF